MTVSGGLKDSKVTLQQEGIVKKTKQASIWSSACSWFFLILQCDYVKTSGFYFLLKVCFLSLQKH